MPTRRGDQNAIVAFTAFVADTRYQWAGFVSSCFGAVPGRVSHELNLSRHTGDYEGRPEANRPLTRGELDKFFTTVDARA